MTHKIIAIIQARSGSKGLPGKNIKDLCGKPLLAWTIEKALRSKYINRVVFSTDSEEYANIAKQYGAEVPFLRPKELASDTANDFEVLIHAIKFLKDKENYCPDYILRLQPTNPTFPVEKIDQGIELILKNKEASSVRAITPSPKHPYKMWKLCKDEKIIQPFLSKKMTGFDEPFNMGRKQLPEVFVQVGAMEILTYHTLVNCRSMAGKMVLPLIVDDPLETINIDSELDFMLAELSLKKLTLKNK